MSYNSAASVPQFNPTAAILAWLWPGLGHMSLGEKHRGMLIMLGVLFLFVGGVFIGGVDCVDRVQDHLWFIAQSFCGPIAFAVDFLNPHYPLNLPEDWQHRYFEDDPQVLSQLRVIGLNKPNEMGTLFCALAGLMNLVAILDALYFVPKGPPQFVERRRAPAPPAPISHS